jgi:hypothetical protein
MANQLTGNPIIIDTPGAGVLLTQALDIMMIKWVSASGVAGHLAVVQDKNGVVKWKSVCNGANYSESDFIDCDSSGLIVPTLGSGELYIYMH